MTIKKLLRARSHLARQFSITVSFFCLRFQVIILGVGEVGGANGKTIWKIFTQRWEEGKANIQNSIP